MRTLCSSSALLLVSLFAACGGEEPANRAGGPTRQDPQPARPVEGDTVARDVARDTGERDTGERDTKTQGAPRDAAQGTPEANKPKRPVPRPKVDYTRVKTMFSSEPSSAPAEVAATPEIVSLGRALYHATAPSKGGDTSCATCHALGNYGADGLATPPGDASDRNTPTTYNAARQFAQGWDYRYRNVEQMAVPHVTDPALQGVADEAALVEKLRSDQVLVALFDKAFPGENAVSAQNFATAIGAFVRTLTTKSKWDEYLDGDQRALDDQQLLGLKTFMDIGCTTCHITRLAGGHIPQKLGLLKPYSGADTGRMRSSGSPADKNMFKVPLLLNVEKTAPYYHDGSIATLDEAVRNMASIQLGLDLKPEQTAAIVAFLQSMTGPTPAEFAAGK